MYEVQVITGSDIKGPRKKKGQIMYRLETVQSNGRKAWLENYIDIEATANQSELIAVNEALKRIKKGCRVVIHTDSRYVAAGFNEGWIYQWIRSGWKNAKGKEIANKEEWLEMLNLLKGRSFKFMLNEGEKQ